MPDDEVERDRRVDRLLAAALEQPASEREAFVSEQCGVDTELRLSVISLLRTAESEETELATGAPLRGAFGKALASDGSQESPRRIGPYRLLELIGEGGMGEVWLAEQLEPVERKVALKLIKQGMDTKQVVARFQAERQALAMMDHPAIAKVYDGGATPEGRPYFVMEYVRGEPITTYCDRERLTNLQRIDLFLHVCEGVQHAHQKAVIHRDIKPSNVLVSVQDGKASPKIIDFGVAKATAKKLTEKTIYTQLGMMIGTPEYMSPEQAEMTGLNVDTRTDVYALGVMLYELIVGALPFEPRKLREAGFEATVRRIREDEPQKPSTRLSTLGERSIESAKKRGTEPTALRRQLTGDLDWITMKALEKDRNRRYGSPQELADDLRRHLSDQPVLASPPSPAYRCRKFIRRHTTAVSMATVGVFVLVAFASSMAVQAKRIALERDRADAQAEARGQVAEFMKNLFAVSDPGEARGNSITARELLDLGARRIEQLDDEETRAELMATIGDVYLKLGLYPQAEPLLAEAVAEKRRVLGDDHIDTLRSMDNLALLYFYQARYRDSEALYLETLDAQKRVLGADHPETLRSMGKLARGYRSQGRFDEAEQIWLDAYRTQERVLGADHPDTLDSQASLSKLYVEQGRYDEAEPLCVQVFESRMRVLGEDHPDTLVSMSTLGNLYWYQGRPEEAEPLWREVLETQKRVIGEDHPDTLMSMINVGHLYRLQRRYEEAERLFARALETQTRTLGEDHPDSLLSMHNLALVYWKQNRYEEAESMYRDTVETRRRVHGDEHVRTLNSMHSLARLYLSLGRHEEAEPLLLETVETRMRVLGKNHRKTVSSLYDFARLQASRGDRIKAMASLRRAVEAGYADATTMSRESVFESLHGEEFDEVVEQARQNQRAQPAS